jgi:hypothetical protein
MLAGKRDVTASIHWLRTHQLGCGAPADQRGAVSADGKFAADTALRATGQAGQALAGMPFTTLTATGAAAGAPVLACAVAASPTPSPTSSAPAGTLSPTPSPTPSPAAEPGLANTNAVDGSAVVRLTVIGAALVAVGLAALLAVRRRT